MRPGIAAIVFLLTFALRVWGVSTTFSMLGDQIRDWTIALRSVPMVSLGLGPAYYWVLWLIRIAVGPWFDNLPHAGAIGQAVLTSAADVMLLAAIWQRSKSLLAGLAAIAIAAATSFDLTLSATISNLVVATALAKIAVALVVFDVPRRSAIGVVLTAAIAWCAVQSATTTTLVAVAVLAAIVATGDRHLMTRNAWLTAITIALLQVPHAVQGSDPVTFFVMGSDPKWIATMLLVLSLVLPRAVPIAGPALVVAAILFVPAALAPLPVMRRMPEYAPLVDGSRKMARVRQPLREIHTNFDIPPSSSSEFLYVVLGRRLDPDSAWVGVIERDGGASYSVSPAR